MKNRTHLYVSRKNVLTWVMALCMVASAVTRIVFSGGKGSGDAWYMWSQILLPIAATLLYPAITILNGRELFYKTAIPVWMMVLYAGLWVSDNVSGRMMIWLFWIALLFFAYLYTDITCGRIPAILLLLPLVCAPLGFVLYFYRTGLLGGDPEALRACLPDVLMLFGMIVLVFAIRLHPLGEYHPTWGDRTDGRRVRTLPPMSQVSPYLMVNRNGSTNYFEDSLEISHIDRYIRQKRREGLTNFGLTHVFITAYCRLVAKYPALNRFLSGQRVYSRGDDIQYCMAVKKEMSTDAPDTCIKLHLKPSDTVYDVYRKFNEAVEEVKNTPLNSEFDQTAKLFTLLPGLLFKFTVWLLKTLDYFGLIPKFLLEISPFHGSVFFTSMGSLGIPAIVHHLYDFGNLPVFIAFGCKYRRNELAADGSVRKRKYVDMTFNLDERICDGFYYASALKYLRHVLADPHRLDTPPEKVEQDID